MTTCTELVRERGVDLAGTASAIASFLLLELPGPWGEDAREQAYRAALGPRWDELEELWLGRQLRPLVVRRPGRATGRPPVLLVGSTRGPRFLEQLAAQELPGVDLASLADGRPGHGEPVDGPVLAVCTNGSVDRCCAVRGRPLAAALAAAHPERTWEVSHVGGCRFAPNLLVLPSGAMHGGLTPQQGLQVAADALAGRTALVGLRGRTALGRVETSYACAADVGLRRRLGLERDDDVEVLAERLHDDAVDGEDGPVPAGADVLLRHGTDRWRAVVRHRCLGTGTSVCDGEQPVTTTALTDLRPA